MPQPSRAERRRQGRGGAAPPPRRDPMRPIYIGVGVAFVAIVLALPALTGGKIAHPTSQRDADAGPQRQPKVGCAVQRRSARREILQAEVSRYGAGRPRANGGWHRLRHNGVLHVHVHPHLAIFYNGKQIQVPQFIGFAPSLAGSCLYWIHTHDASGVIHIEAPDLSPPQGGPFTLGMLFDIWGQPLQPDDVAGLKGDVTATSTARSTTAT